MFSSEIFCDSVEESFPLKDCPELIALHGESLYILSVWWTNTIQNFYFFPLIFFNISNVSYKKLVKRDLTFQQGPHPTLVSAVTLTWSEQGYLHPHMASTLEPVHSTIFIPWWGETVIKTLPNVSTLRWSNHTQATQHAKLSLFKFTPW